MNDQDKAFLESGALYFDGKALAPFSAMRQAACIAAGAKFDAPTAMLTILAVLYVCSHGQDEINKCFNDVEKFRKSIFDWADENGISISSEKYLNGAELVGKISLQMKVSQFEEKKDAPREYEDGEIPNG